jgi:hypothetical protein
MELVGEDNTKFEPVSTKSKNNYNFGSFEEANRDGYVLFSLGPLYVYASIQESIIDRFRSEHKDIEMKHDNIYFDRNVVARCEKWNYVLELMDRAVYPYFQQWMLAQIFMLREERNIIVPRRFLTPILDPFLFDKGIRKPASMDVYTVSSMKKLLRPKCEVSFEEAPSYIDFEFRAPEQEVISLGESMLPMVGIK